MDTPLSNADLTAHLKGVRGFVGVYSYDLLPRLEDEEFCVINTDNVMPLYDPPEGGHHWLTVCRDGGRILVFDSFGRNLKQMERDYTEPHLERYFMEAYPDCELYTNTQVLQHTSTAVCGRYAILMGQLFSSQGIDSALETLKRTFTSNTLNNDRKIMMVGGGAAAAADDDDDEDEDEGWTEKLTAEMHKQRRVHFPRRRVVVHAIDDIWSADLVDMQKFAKYNKGTRFLLTVIDLFSRYAWVRPLKDKTGVAVRDAFRDIVQTSGRKPRRLWVDEGKEFYNRTLKTWLSDNRIDLYSTHNEGKAVVVERFNRTLKSRMWRHFTLRSTSAYINALPALVDSYNESKHRSIGMTPKEASRSEKERFMPNPAGRPPPTRLSRAARAPRRFQVGDKVRITVNKLHAFEKGYTPNWTEEVFVVDQVLPTNPITYRIRDLMDEPILGSFYGQQLQKTDQATFRIEKVLRKHRGKALVKWRAYSDKFNSWVPVGDLAKLK